MKWTFVIFLIFFFYYCTNKENLDIAGSYYVCYKDGKELAETDSSNKLYIHFKKDNTYQLIDCKDVESGWWRTSDYDEFSITYFYDSYLKYLLDGPVGETMLTYSPDFQRAKTFTMPIWNSQWKSNKYLLHQILFCEQGKKINEEDMYKTLKEKYGNDLRNGK